MNDQSGPEPLHPERLTWTALLGHWVAFARNAVGLPDDAEGQRMRASVADVIMLQAVWFALQQVDELDRAERALGLDRAAVLIEKHAAALEQRWQGQAMPEAMRGLIDDARAMLKAKEGA
ncbi:MAG: hypothetical protein WD534_10170 [Phycisphaeraceae bacterium]